MLVLKFFWGKMTLSLIVFFVLSMLVEWLSTCNLIKLGTHRLAAALKQTLMPTLRMGLTCLVMLALMSFNGGIFIVAVAGHSTGFLLVGSRMFKLANETLVADLPPMKC